MTRKQSSKKADKGKAEGRGCGAAAATGEETRARRDARMLIERWERTSAERAPYEDSGLYKPVTFEEAKELVDRILSYDADREAHALITLLNGIAAAYFAERKDKDHKLASVEGLAHVAAFRAYTHTMHYSDSVGEFARLDADTFEEVEALRKEYFGEEGGEGR